MFYESLGLTLPEWKGLSPRSRQSLRRIIREMNKLGNTPTPAAGCIMTTTGWSTPAVPQTAHYVGEPQEKKMELALNTEVGSEATKRNHLSMRAYSIFYDKEAKMERKYGLRDDRSPQNAEELIQRIKDGKFIIREDKDRQYYCPIDQILWRDPSIKKDQAGYDEKRKGLKKDFTALTDKLAIGTPEDGLTALQAWEAAD